MSVLLDEETRVVDLAALEFGVPCVVPEAHAAEVALVCRGCGNSDFACREHSEQHRADIERLLDSGLWEFVMCRRCKRKSRSWDEAIREVAL